MRDPLVAQEIVVERVPGEPGAWRARIMPLGLSLRAHSREAATAAAITELIEAQPLEPRHARVRIDIRVVPR